MPVKFKLGFTIDAETLFGIMSKFLPVTDLVVEELVEQRGFDPLADRTHHHLPKPKRAPQVRRNNGIAMDIHSGANAVIMAAFSDGEKHAGADCFTAMKAAGYATNGIYNKFKRLQRHGILDTHKGLWWLTPEGKKLWEAPRAVRESAA
jgi:hypothetical protein